uniref:Aquaporin n=1 Tax=Cuerna arida TaxID=1464854 RepID=A0A1B6FF84_9HEMI
MADRKIRVVSSNGHAVRSSRRQEPDVWSKLRGDEDFKNMDTQKMWELVSIAVAELLGTAILVGLGCSGLMTGIPGTDPAINHLNIVLTFACAVSLCVTVFGHISGCHINPAVSLSAVIFGHISLPKFFLYVISQCVGACFGIFAVKLISPDYCTAENFCVTLPNPHVGPGKAMLAEAFTTGILVWVVDAIWDRRCQDKHDSLPVKFGFAVIALALPGAKYSGASLNPARSFGPALIAGNFTDHWVYWIGPMGGSILASAIYKTFLSEVTPPQSAPLRNRIDDPEEEHPL